MPNGLEFALGLQTSEFLSKLGFASEEILSLAGLAELVRKAWDNTWEAMAKGAELKALSSATSESVANLYKFEHGLEAIGAQTQSMPMFFMLMQKALSGVNETGQRTGVIFSQLGLDLGKLRAEDTVTAITQVAGALNKLNPAQAAGVAESLFGRFQAQSVLEIARNMDLFQGGMSAGSNTGALLDKFASAFQEVKADWGDINGDVLGVWTALGGAIAPEMHKIFSKIHDDIKNIGPALIGAIEGGHVEELLRAAIEAGGEQGTNFLEAGLASAALGFGEALYASMVVAISDFFPMLVRLSSNVDMIENLILGESVGKLTGNKKMVQNNQEMLKALVMVGSKEFGSDLLKSIQDLFSGAGGIGGDVESTWNTMLKNAPHGKLDALTAFVNALAAPIIGAGSSGKPGAGKTIDPLENHYRHEFTALEKMGFVMNGRSHIDLQQRQVDLLQTIASNTTELINGRRSDPTLPGAISYIEMGNPNFNQL